MTLGFSAEEVSELVEAHVRKLMPLGDEAHVEVTHRAYSSPEWLVETYSRAQWMKKQDKLREAEERAAKRESERKREKLAGELADPEMATADI